MKKILIFISLIFLIFLLTGCYTITSMAVLRLPNANDFFVTTGDLPAKDYDPIAIIQANVYRPASSHGKNLDFQKTYSDIEKILNDKIMKKAKQLGANGLIRLEYAGGKVGLKKSLFTQDVHPGRYDKSCIKNFFISWSSVKYSIRGLAVRIKR